MPDAQLVVVHPTDDAVLLVDGALPVVPASGLLSAGSALGLPLVVVRTLRRDGESRVTLCELLGEPPADATWARAQEWMEQDWRREPVRPWLRRGWVAATLARVDEILARDGRHRTGLPTQLRHWGLSSVLRVPAAGGDVVVKQTLPMFGDEPRVMRWLDSAGSGVVPALLDVDDGEHWWLMQAVDVRERDAEPGGLLALSEVRARVAESVGSLDLPVRSLAVLSEGVGSLAGRDDILFATDWNLQSTDGRLPSRSFTERDRDALVAVLPEISRRIERLDALGIADTLVHGDFHVNNVGWDGSRWIIFDWANACVAHPFMDLPMWLQWSREPEASLSAYLGDSRHAWDDAAPVAQLWHALTLLPLAEAPDDGGAEWSAGIQARVLQALRALGHGA